MTVTNSGTGFGTNAVWRQAQVLLDRRQVDAAHPLVELLQRDGHPMYAALLAAQIAWMQDRVRDAAAQAVAAASVAQDDPDTLCAITNVLLEAGESATARRCLSRIALNQCNSQVQLMRVASMHKELHEHGKALEVLDRAVALGPIDAPLRFIHGLSLVANGRISDAEVELAKSLTEAPERGRVAVPLVRLRQQTADRNYLAAIDKGSRLVTRGTSDAAAFEFARYKTLEDLGRYNEAWQALARGNAIMHARLTNRMADHGRWLQSYLAAWPATPKIASDTTYTGPQPIFIVGMPRSGTTVLERMLGNHSRVAVAGELTDLDTQLRWVADTRNTHGEKVTSRMAGLDYGLLGQRYLEQTQWHAAGNDFYIDKQPTNWLWTGAIHAALPHAPILHMVRDPMDTCFSLWRAWFGEAAGYAYDLDALATAYADYQQVMAHWHRIMPGAILDVAYADLVQHPTDTLRKVFDFCHLDWEPGCTDITRNQAPSGTPSAAEVRSPLHTQAFGEWRRYATGLASLRKQLLPTT